MEEKKIEITREDFRNAAIDMITNDKSIIELIKNVPSMMLVIPVLTVTLWDALVRIKEENENGKTE